MRFAHRVSLGVSRKGRKARQKNFDVVGFRAWPRFFDNSVAAQFQEDKLDLIINISDDYLGHDNMVSLFERMQELHKRSAAAKDPNDKIQLQREIEATDRQIDQLVYELYGLTEEEIEKKKNLANDPVVFSWAGFANGERARRSLRFAGPGCECLSLAAIERNRWLAE
jgi:hypothetical protein